MTLAFKEFQTITNSKEAGPIKTVVLDEPNSVLPKLSLPDLKLFLGGQRYSVVYIRTTFLGPFFGGKLGTQFVS